ncbi:hypothetical protein DSCA_49050 [Desulfosarcina alkanivorans]|uniref:Transcriptional regulator n=1 Tax=Desulfosarcina alkanivorans TaxID=571177 RepID=A0A5K7YRL7_9BACT|nr:AlpA family phage regulatory protein [Desulfosarcina alkanivorans]BBO70975.1 hypothetical protein DSCA_49050 [Desulfosarcina alkanivorans]
MQERVIRWPELEKRIGVSNVTAWRWEKAGKFPKRIRLGGNSAGWIESEVDEWIKQRAAER